MTELREIGLTEYEEKIYMTLLREGSLTGGQASKLSKVPHGRTYEVLHTLAQKGFVSILPIKPKIFKAVDPKIAVKEYIDNKTHRLNEIAQSMPHELQRLKDVQIKKEWLGEKITIVSGKANMLKIIKNSIDTAEKYTKTMYTYEIKDYPINRSQDAAIKRGVKVKHIATLMTHQGLKWMKEDIKRGVKVKYYPVQELRITVRDGIDSFQTLVNPGKSKDRITMIIESQELTKALELYFDSIWRKAKKIGDIKQKDILMK